MAIAGQKFGYIARRIGRLTTLSVGVYLQVVATGCSTPAQPQYDIEAWGLSYQLQVQTSPRPNRIHVLRVDLAAGKAELRAVTAADPDGDGPAEAALTDPRILAADSAVLAFINTNPFDSFPDEAGEKDRGWHAGQAVDITGLAAHGGQVISSADRGRAAVWVDAKGRAHIDVVPADGDVVEGVGGWGVIVKDGEIIPRLVKGKAKLDATNGSEHLNPVTGIGVDKTGQILWLVVVDGRQSGFSEGVSHYGLATILRDLGCWNGALMDGGGSTIMGLSDSAGRVQIANSPSGRTAGLIPKIRPLPIVLTVRRKPVTPNEPHAQDE